MIRDFPSRTVRFELLHSSGLTGSIVIGGESFSSTATAGDTLLVTFAANAITVSFVGITGVSIIRYEGKYFYRIIYETMQ